MATILVVRNLLPRPDTRGIDLRITGGKTAHVLSTATRNGARTVMWDADNKEEITFMESEFDTMLMALLFTVQQGDEVILMHQSATTGVTRCARWSYNGAPNIESTKQVLYFWREQRYSQIGLGKHKGMINLEGRYQ